jgi:hypothetical protein
MLGTLDDDQALSLIEAMIAANGEARDVAGQRGRCPRR